MPETLQRKVLIVEDDPDIIDIFSHKFTAAGFAVIMAKSGKEGIAAVEKEKPDLILSDMIMQPMSGKEMAQTLRASGIKTPITFLTNSQDIEFVATFKPEDNYDYLIKANTPIDEIVAKSKARLGYSWEWHYKKVKQNSESPRNFCLQTWLCAGGG